MTSEDIKHQLIIISNTLNYTPPFSLPSPSSSSVMLQLQLQCLPYGAIMIVLLPSVVSIKYMYYMYTYLRRPLLSLVVSTRCRLLLVSYCSLLSVYCYQQQLSIGLITTGLLTVSFRVGGRAVSVSKCLFVNV